MEVRLNVNTVLIGKHEKMLADLKEARMTRNSSQIIREALVVLAQKILPAKYKNEQESTRK